MKVFINNRLTRKELRSKIYKFAKECGVQIITFSNKGRKVKGTYNARTKSLYVDLKQTKTELLHTFFHELGHHFAVKNNKWKSYHYGVGYVMLQEKVFEIENKIDQIAEKLWYKHVDIKKWGRYKYTYLKSQKNNIINTFI